MTTLNSFTIAGRIVAKPEVKFGNLGSRKMRLLVNVTREGKGTYNVFPITKLNPSSSDLELTNGDQVLIVGRLLRRLWIEPDNARRSGIELRASTIVSQSSPSGGHFVEAPTLTDKPRRGAKLCKECNGMPAEHAAIGPLDGTKWNGTWHVYLPVS